MLKNSICGVLLGAGLALAGTVTPDAAKAIEGAEKAWVQATVKADQTALGKLLGDDLSYTHSNAKTETKADVLEVARSGSTTYEEITFSEVKMRQFGATVVVTHKAMIRTKQNGVANLYVTHVWARQAGGWQLVSRQATRLPQ